MVKKEWLKSMTSVEELEIKHLRKDKRLGPEPIIFGFIHNHWMNLKRQLQKGDELWEYCSPIETWENYYGQAGICIVRNDEIIAEMLTRRN